MSTTGAALVHPSTSKLGPADQAQGVYEYTPPLVLAYLRGETLSQVDLADVEVFFGAKGMPLPRIERSTGPQGPALADRSAVMPATFAAAYGGSPSKFSELIDSIVEPSEGADLIGIKRRVVRKEGKTPDPTPYDVMEHIVATALSTYTDGQKDALFNQLAAELGYSVE